VRTPSLEHREKHSEQKKVEKQVKNRFPVFWQFAGSAIQSCTMVLAGLASESRRMVYSAAHERKVCLTGAELGTARCMGAVAHQIGSSNV
jgi:hypothetical protein